MIGSRDPYVEFSRKRPGTDDSPRVRGRRVCRKSLRRTGQCVVKKSDDANPCRFTSVRATHKLVGSAHSLSPRPADGVVRGIMHGWRHHPASHACMRVEKKNPSDAPVQSNVACTPARLKLSRPGSTRHLRVAVSGRGGRGIHA